MKHRTLSILVALYTIGACTALASTHYVTTAGSGDGVAWATAASLTSALTAAQDGDQLWLADGTYAGSTLTIASNNITLYGGFTNGMATFGERSWTNYPAILDGEGTRRVLLITSTNLTLDGLVITNGASAVIKDAGGGAGIRKADGGGSLRLVNCRIVGNKFVGIVYGYGGGAYIRACSVVITNCLIANNSYSGGRNHWGPGIYATNVNMVMTDCAFTNNTGGSYSRGGGLFLSDSTLWATNCSFIANRTPYTRYEYNGGGATYLSWSTALFKNCLFRGNRADGQFGGGGTFHVSGGSSSTVTVENCTIADTYAVEEGGAFYVWSGNVVMKNTIIWNSTVSGVYDVGRIIYNGSAPTAVTLDYCCLENTESPYIDGFAVTITHELTNNPMFATTNYTDLHLKSSSGRWDIATSQWTNDAVHSPCIDFGDGTTDYSDEPDYNGGRVNLGAYGNTAQASKSPPAAAPAVTNRAPSIVGNVATLKGELLAGSSTTITFWYGTNQSDLDLSEQVPLLQTTGTVFSATVGNLATNIQYWYTCFATNGAGTNWAVPKTNFLTSIPARGGPDIIHVDANAPSPVETGLDWCNAFKTIANGLAAIAGSTDTLWIAAGTYNECTVDITTNVTIYGGFTNGITTLDGRNWSNNPVVIDGKLLARAIEITAADVTLDGITIRKGNPPESYDNGSGIRKQSGGGSLTVRHCTFDQNGGIWGNNSSGGGLYAANTTVLVDDCLFASNWMSAYSRGGGIAVSGGTLAVSNSTFIGNYTSCGAPDDGGGGGHILDAPARFVNCIFRDNCAHGWGGGNFRGHGGALHISGSASTTVTVENCTVVTNYAYTKTGGFYVYSGNLSIKNSILKDNISPESPATIYNGEGDNAVTIDYSCLDGTGQDKIDGYAIPLNNGLTNNPLFVAEFSDLHLKSTGGRWDPALAEWTNDTVASMCIDAGDSGSAYATEPDPDGGRINMGAYGNTIQASKSPPGVTPVLTNRAPTVYGNAATIRGEMIAGSPSDITFWYGTNQSSLNMSSHLAFLQVTGTMFSATVGGLATNMQYWYTCFATNVIGTNWAMPYTNFLTTTPLSGGSDVIHVDKNAPSPIETGLDWCNAYKTFVAGAMALGGTTATIWIAEGTYDDGATAQITTDAIIYGGFTNGMTSLSARNHTNHPVILSGNDVRSVLNISGTNVTLDGLSVNAGNTALLSQGGGITKTTGGGSLALVDCNMIGNVGRAIFCKSCSVTLTNCTLTDNNFTPGGFSGTRGGGMYASNATIVAVNSTFTNNYTSSYGRGGLLYLHNGSFTATGCTFEYNRTGCGNTYQGGGVVLFEDNAAAEFANCIFRNNRALGWGGGNFAGYGGVLNMENASTVTVENCTIVTNYAYTRGGAFYITTGKLILKNSIAWDGTAQVDTGELIYNVSGDTISIDYCCMEGTNGNYVVGDTAQANVITNDPLFAANYTDLHLKSKHGRWIGDNIWTNDKNILSSCIDAGDEDSVYSTEQEPNGGNINLGAYGNTIQASKSPGNAGTLFMLR